ncbi:MAG: type II toxin-antitoxin system PemK/MazF family toxin [Bacteroidota bacterium]|nr:type II toxin-antitoxin system PemK/MazF family toxin [Bacteroidota bacterium]
MSNNNEGKEKCRHIKSAYQKGHSTAEPRCDIMIDQVRAIDNRRLVRKIGSMPHNLSEKVKENLRIVLDLE